MELTSAAIEEVIHPTAAFLQAPSPRWRTSFDNGSTLHPTWDDSLLNPKNRMDSLDLPDNALWRIDGCTGLGTQYYTIPVCLSQVPPMRIDVFIPENQPLWLREQLDLHKAFHTKDGPRVSRLAITRHIIRALQYWTQSTFRTLEDFGRFYRSVPFGSRIVFERLSLNSNQIDIKIGQNHNLELKLLSLSSLTSLWGTAFSFLKLVDIFEVQVVAILHDSVCVVRISGEIFILKALISDTTKYLYHELKTLCTLEPHCNIIGRPIHLIRKPTNFGGKNAIVGFTTFYHSRGSLRDLLPQLRIHGQLQRRQQFKWSIQLARALIHIRTRSSLYYPDLRLDNIVLSENLDAVMVDFEQRGVWCEFAAPEVNAIEYIRLIATDERMPHDVRAKYRRIMLELVPEFEELQKDQYTNPCNGYNTTWIALSSEEHEAAEVYMLGRVLWCIFEGVSGPQKAAVWQSYRWESDLEFPDYSRTPAAMRDLIDRCTRGRRPNLGSIIARHQSQLVLRHQHVENQESHQVQEAAKAFWLAELDWAEDFLRRRRSCQELGDWRNNHYGRPNLQDVLSDLTNLQAVEG
ncbi:hypothetical protein GGR57DRAFT_209516 [Xylariaceae sp. FL1272]|nr:hypothetical protein GGR57DRAFT_209516 [Xylariaceae sp. FL1272]